MRRTRIRLAILFLLAACATTITIPENEYGLEVVDSLELYERIVEAEPSHRLVDLRTVLDRAKFDIRYATDDNFMERILYPVAGAWLRAPAAEALARVEEDLAEEGVGLKIFDGYRPYSVTEMMWEPYQDPNYVADPAKGSRHNRGAAVDLTLVDLATGEELEMPTGYDDFSPRAHHDFDDLPDHVLEHRELLRATAERHGFEALPSEWWHYDFRGWEEFALMDIGLDELAEAEGAR
ncbi:MAG: M15 family metallopeptidase [Thermoanaerobaculia bacterium]|nr:M15 family metallopeptidase [Thermoanaerobaculia bacterium]